MTAPTKEHILREIRRLAEEDGGAAPGMNVFEDVTGIRVSQWRGKYWARWSDAVREAGYEPNTWNARTLDDDQVLEALALATRELGKFPTRAELEMRRRTVPGVPDPRIFRRRLGPRADQIRKLVALADSDPQLADVAEICAPLLERAPRTTKSSTPAAVVTGAVYLIRMGEFHKIGKTNDPGRRLYEIGLHLPQKHELVHLIETDDPGGIEAYWHRRFAAQRSNGEWFTLTPENVAAFQRRTYQ